ncbi:sortase B family protein (plasmid) [Butyrivibrio proteoclasticus B316]|uniref:Sortase B family protein n=1 Tax=Butyrivibrio proteoclasticus (strain ATCC 51982 / DSM 14932 / B316) TaxID=515622 RepID=E0S4H9_BUTPB|nr:class B sortase [Butyrivibrio proteoclasticus]ADL36311.1 sortase B family protein [Butyrivibrio proteoclasticus B316]
MDTQHNGKRANIAKALLIALIPAISLIAALMFLIHYQKEYEIADNEYEQVADDYAKETSDIGSYIKVLAQENPGAKDSLDEKMHDATEGNLKKVDFLSLINENSDVTAWITVPFCSINYPVVQGPDNDKYLKTTYQGTANSAGAIFMDYTNNRSFNDMHTLVYGHNMKNNSMFGGLKKIRDNPEAAKEDPYFYIYLPDGHMRQYEIFSARVIHADDPCYRFFDGMDEYHRFVNECLSGSKSKWNVNSDLSSGLPIVTLSTCSGDNDRFVVHGILHAIY